MSGDVRASNQLSEATIVLPSAAIQITIYTSYLAHVGPISLESILRDRAGRMG